MIGIHFDDNAVLRQLVIRIRIGDLSLSFAMVCKFVAIEKSFSNIPV